MKEVEREEGGREMINTKCTLGLGMWKGGRGDVMGNSKYAPWE